jgi:ribonucleoside-triphosphate reductase
MLKIIKRDGREVEFQVGKIQIAISKANNEVEPPLQLTEEDIKVIANEIFEVCKKSKYSKTVAEIQELVETGLMKHGFFEVARRYITYRYLHDLKRNTTDAQVMSLIECNNEEVKQENSNKNPTVVSVQRDYMAGEVSKDISRRYLLDFDIIDAHDQGIIHFHDMDYFAQHISNCCLLNLEDMLQNGTVISGTMIEKPHSFSTACNITTQIIAQVSSSQYGGQSIDMSHLVPFVEVSRKKIREEVTNEIKLCNGDLNKVNDIVEARLKKEINKGIQTIQYQVVTIMTTNGWLLGRYKTA